MRKYEVFFCDKTRKYVLWGCGEYGKRVCSLMEYEGVCLDCCVDGEISKQGELFLDRWVIYAPDMLEEKSKEYYIIISFDINKNVFVREKLLEWGYDLELQVITYKELYKVYFERLYKTLL